MCLGCWDEEGRPWKVTPAVRKWAPKFHDADSWGALHIVVEDWNLDDINIEFRRWQSPKEEEMDLLSALQAMTQEERWTTAILADNPEFDPYSLTPLS